MEEWKSGRGEEGKRGRGEEEKRGRGEEGKRGRVEEGKLCSKKTVEVILHTIIKKDITLVILIFSCFSISL